VCVCVCVCECVCERERDRERQRERERGECLPKDKSNISHTEKDTLSTHLIHVCADNKDRCLRGMHRDGAEPEIKTSMLVTQADVPQQQIHRTV